MCAKFQQKILNYRILELSNFQTNSWFLENNRALSKWLYKILL